MQVMVRRTCIEGLTYTASICQIFAASLLRVDVVFLTLRIFDIVLRILVFDTFLALVELDRSFLLEDEREHEQHCKGLTFVHQFVSLPCLLNSRPDLSKA